MHSRISNSKFENRHIPQKNWSKILFITLAICAFIITAWEFHIRSLGYKATVADDYDLWSYHRNLVDKNPKNTVFLGASRMQHGVSLKTWEEEFKTKPIQLSSFSTTPRIHVNDLADNSSFHGTLIIGMPTPVYFTQNYLVVMPAANSLKYHQDMTPARIVSHKIMKFLESNLAFIEPEVLNLKRFIEELKFPKRPTVKEYLPVPKFSYITSDRQTYMTHKLETNSDFQKEVQQYYEFTIQNVLPPEFSTVPNYEKAFNGSVERLKISIDKIQKRGGKVVIIRYPSSGTLLSLEKKIFPRQKYWDEIIEYTKPDFSIHFEDYASLQNYNLPDESHLNNKDSIHFTQEIIKILKEKKPNLVKNLYLQ